METYGETRDLGQIDTNLIPAGSVELTFAIVITLHRRRIRTGDLYPARH